MGLCLLVGAAGGSLTRDALTGDALTGWYTLLVAPLGTPPNWLFGPVWTTLYITLGVAAWLVWLRPGSYAALRLWGWQLAANAAWPAAFFGLRSPGLGLLVIAVMLGSTGATIYAFHRRRRLAAWLLLPYLAWLSYAAYLNAGFWWLNRI